jgi:hypothetical protein
MWWIVGVVAAVVLVAMYLTWIASRVDRLHARAASAAGALDAQLVRRAALANNLAKELAASGRADHLSANLHAAAHTAIEAEPTDREAAENDLTRALRAAVSSPAGEAASPARREELITASRRAALARQVHNDLVRDARAARRRRLVRVLRLTRKHPEPLYFDVDDPSLEG